MRSIVESSIYLESFSFKEEDNNVVELDIQSVHLDNLNLFIGNNAQGKSRLFRTLKFIKDLLTDKRRKIETSFTAAFEFNIQDKKISYSIKITPSNLGNNYIEEISSEHLIIYP